MKKNKQAEQEYKSYFYQFIWDEWLANYGNDKRFKKEDLFKKIDCNVLLNSSLTINDKAVYLAILKLTSFTKGYRTKISSSQIRNITGTVQQCQTRSIKKLKDAGIINVYATMYENLYTITNEPNKFLPIKLEQFNGIKNKRKEYIRKLTGIILSNGNDRIPTYKTCKKTIARLTKREYKKIQEAYYPKYESETELDKQNYLELAFLNDF